MYVIGINGRARSGKDTVADYLVEHHGFTKVSLADPIKRFARDVFSLTVHQLWGDHRDTAFMPDDDFWDKASDRITIVAPQLAKTLSVGKEKTENFISNLFEWFHGLRHHYSPLSHKLSSRIILQTLGTEFGRNFHQNIWVEHLYNDILPVIARGGYYSAEEGLTAVMDDSDGVVIPDHRFINEVEYTAKLGHYLLRVRRPAKEAEQNVGVSGHASETEQNSIPDSVFHKVLSFPEGIENVRNGLREFCKNTPWAFKMGVG